MPSRRASLPLGHRLPLPSSPASKRGLNETQTTCRQSKEFQQPCPRPVAEGLVRDLADYDRAFGLDTQEPDR